MKIFISWSGKRSKAMAIALKEWLPLILHYTKPWVSEKDISAGDRWAMAIADELESSNFGILCITPENLSSEWIMFEAGALSKSMQDAKVIPLLFGLELSDLSGPLSQFQALKVDQQGLLDVLNAINNVAESGAAEGIIEQLVPALWPKLQEKLEKIPEKEISEKHMRPQTEILEDLVTQVRGLSSKMREFDPEMIEKEMLYKNRYSGESDQYFHLDLLHSLSMDLATLDASLLMLAGILRESMPWMAEILVEAHRDFKGASIDEAKEIAYELNNTTKYISRNKNLSRQFREVGKKNYSTVLRELPAIIENVVSSKISILEMKSGTRGNYHLDSKSKDRGYDIELTDHSDMLK